MILITIWKELRHNKKYIITPGCHFCCYIHFNKEVWVCSPLLAPLGPVSPIPLSFHGEHMTCHFHMKILENICLYCYFHSYYGCRFHGIILLLAEKSLCEIHVQWRSHYDLAKIQECLCNSDEMISWMDMWADKQVCITESMSVSDVQLTWSFNGQCKQFLFLVCRAATLARPW